MGSMQRHGPNNGQNFVDYGFQPVPPNVRMSEQQNYSQQRQTLNYPSQQYTRDNSNQQSFNPRNLGGPRDRNQSNNLFTNSEPVTWKSIRTAFSTKQNPEELSIFEGLC